jgi:N-formylglutamate deformylase
MVVDVYGEGTMPPDPVYRIVPGARDCPIVLHVPHSSRRLTPLARASIRLDNAALSTELDHMTDAHTEVIAARAAARAHGWQFVNEYSRLVVDPERFPDEREQMSAVGMAAVYTRTSHNEVLRTDHVDELLTGHFHPYAEAIADLVDERLADTGQAVIIDVHSYPSRALPYELACAAQFGTDARRPPICLGTDPDHTPQWLLDAAVAAFEPCGTPALNAPFAGCYVPMRHHGTQRAVSSLMVEIRRDLYLTEPGGPPTAGIEPVISALANLLDAIHTRRG